MSSKNSKNLISRLSSVLGIATAGTLLSLPALAFLQPESSTFSHSTSSTEQLISQSTSGGAGGVGGGASGVGGGIGGGTGNNADGGSDNNGDGDTGGDNDGDNDGDTGNNGGDDNGDNDGSSSGGNLGGVRGQDSHGDGGLFEEVYPRPTINNPSTGGGGRPLGGT